MGGEDGQGDGREGDEGEHQVPPSNVTLEFGEMAAFYIGSLGPLPSGVFRNLHEANFPSRLVPAGSIGRGSHGPAAICGPFLSSPG